MKISLQKTGNKTTPYNIHVEIASLTAERNKTYDVPMYKVPKNGYTLYDAEICGFRIEADTPEEAIFLSEKILPGLVTAARFPTYVFIARRSRRLYPVYTIGDEVLATTPGGPVFRHVELAKVREYLTDYLHTMGKLGVPGMSEKLHVRGVSKTNLALIRPLFYLKKRAVTPNDKEFWAPVFVSHAGNTIYAYAANDRREVDLNGGHEILRLRSQVAQALIADQRLADDLDLRADRLLPEYWDRVKSTLNAQTMKLTFNDTVMDVYRNDKFLIAVEYRETEDRYSFYIGRNPDELKSRTAKDLIRRGIIASDNAVTIK